MKNLNTLSKSQTILMATLVSGLLDAIAAIIVYGIFFKYNPVQIYQFVASGLLGDTAYQGGWPVAVLGLAIHFLIAWVGSFLFVLLYPKIPMLMGNKFIVGLGYGLAIWVVMNLLVIPASKIPAAPFDFVSVLAIIWHMALVGLPISIIANNYYKSPCKI